MHDGRAMVGQRLADQRPDTDPGEVGDLEAGVGAVAARPLVASRGRDAARRCAAIKLREQRLVLPERRRGPLHPHRRPGQLRERAGIAVPVDVQPEAARFEVFVPGDVRDGVERREHEAVGDGALEQLVHRAARDEVMHQRGGQSSLAHRLREILLHEPGQFGRPLVDINVRQLAGELTLLRDPAHEDRGVPQAQPARHHRESGIPVFARMHGKDAAAGRLGALRGRARRIVAGVGREAGGVHQRPDDRRLLRDIEVLSEPRALPLAQRDRGVGRGLHAGVDRGLREADRHRRTIAVALQPHQSARRFDREVGSGTPGPRPIAAVRRDRDVDE